MLTHLHPTCRNALPAYLPCRQGNFWLLSYGVGCLHLVHRESILLGSLGFPLQLDCRTHARLSCVSSPPCPEAMSPCAVSAGFVVVKLRPGLVVVVKKSGLVRHLSLLCLPGFPFGFFTLADFRTSSSISQANFLLISVLISPKFFPSTSYSDIEISRNGHRSLSGKGSWTLYRSQNSSSFGGVPGEPWDQNVNRSGFFCYKNFTSCSTPVRLPFTIC